MTEKFSNGGVIKNEDRKKKRGDHEILTGVFVVCLEKNFFGGPSCLSAPRNFFSVGYIKTGKN